ncbi:MAG: hypothetical protein NZ954_08620 [Thermofilaceae archaeon]|nr:hypothetical protein [Thermofilaceae archaeon]MCX8179959.1 hypothetical protein [Thermofilaceae archaeon]MDW8004735.1 hypothetical protein [Thermofilaceae archaeon]
MNDLKQALRKVWWKQFTGKEIEEELEEIMKNKKEEKKDKKQLEPEEMKKKKKKKDDPLSDFLENIFWEKIQESHPLVNKAIDWGNIKKDNVLKKFEAYNKLSEKFYLIIKSETLSSKDINELGILLEKLEDQVIEYVSERYTYEAKKGLRHIHAPGSVSRDEALNLYFGESYTHELLSNLSSRLCNSIALGDDMGIYTDDEELTLNLQQLIQGFGSSFKIDTEDLQKNFEIESYELSYPYIVFTKFILKLASMLYEEETDKKELLHSILDRLKQASITIFFMPNWEKEKWSILALPRLEFFFDRWIYDEEGRKKLNSFMESINYLIRNVLETAKKLKDKKKAMDMIDLLMIQCDLLLRNLLVHGEVEFQALRRIMELTLDMSSRYGVRAFMKPLTMTV